LRTFRWKLDDRQYLPLAGREISPSGLVPAALLGAGLVDPGGELVGERVSAVRAPRVERAAVLAVLRRLEEQAPGDLDDVPVNGNDAGSGRHAERRHRTVARRAGLGPDPVVPGHRQQRRQRRHRLHPRREQLRHFLHDLARQHRAAVRQLARDPADGAGPVPRGRRNERLAYSVDEAAELTGLSRDRNAMLQEVSFLHGKEKVYGRFRNGAPGQRPNSRGRQVRRGH
jgi:hypothetical protein